MTNLNLHDLEPEARLIQSKKDYISEEAQQSIAHIALNLFGTEHGIDLKLPQSFAQHPLDLNE